MVLQNSLRQMLRTPAKTVLFFLLIALTTMFLAVGVSLLGFTQKSIEAYEQSFQTIATVQQQPKMLKEYAMWNQAQQDYRYSTYPVYDSLIPLSVLDFEGVPYIHFPEKRPFYGAYHESYDMGYFYQNLDLQWMILELSPVQDCIPSQPVHMKVKRILYGKPGQYNTDVLFCDPYNENPQPMYAGKTYVMSVAVTSSSFFHGYEDQSATESVFVPTMGVESTQYSKMGVKIPDRYGDGAEGWEEVTEGYYDTLRGQRWAELMKAIKRIPKTIPVIPTGATQLLMAFYSGSASITEGRDISGEEYADGSKVCLVQRQFAKDNGISPGDKLPLPLYFADYMNTPIVTGNIVYGGLLNAEGKAYPVFENRVYTVVGIYDIYGASYDSSAFGIVGNTVIIPSASVSSSDESNIIAWGPMTAATTSFEIPNGAIGLFEEKWSRERVDGLKITFYDKGYTRLKMGMDRIYTMSIIMLIISAVVMVLVLVLFTFLFIGKNKKRTAIERSLGYKRRQCAASLLFGMLLIVVLGGVIGACGSVWFCNVVVEQNRNATQAGGFDVTYSNWVNDADKPADLQVDVGVVSISTLVALLIAIMASGSLIAGVGVWRNLRAEPMKLLCHRESE